MLIKILTVLCSSSILLSCSDDFGINTPNCTNAAVVGTCLEPINVHRKDSAFSLYESRAIIRNTAHQRRLLYESKVRFKKTPKKIKVDSIFISAD